jgi:hypothetical protein
VLRRQRELHIFARDPQEESFALLKTDVNADDSIWRRQTSLPIPANTPPWFLPSDAVMPYPPAPFFAGTTPLVLRPVQNSDFWGVNDAAVRGGPGGEPLVDGTVPAGSIKAIRLLRSGLCSREVPIQDILNQVGNGFRSSVLSTSGVCKPGSWDGSIDYIDATSILEHQPPQGTGGGDLNPTDVHGGFFLTSKVRLHDAGGAQPLNLDDCFVSFVATYPFGLKDGRLALDPAAVATIDFDHSKTLCTGFFFGSSQGFVDKLQNGLTSTVPAAFAAVTEQLQSFSGPASDSAWACTPSSTGQLGSECKAARNEFDEAIFLGAMTLGIPNPGPGGPTARLRKAAGLDQNWRCVAHPTPADVCRGVVAGSAGRCEYVLRAKRINVNPDTVDLVWFDDDDDFDNPAYAAFVASFVKSETERDFEAYKQLCERPSYGVVSGTNLNETDSNFYPRQFENFHDGEHVCPPPPPPPPPSPPPQCPCSQDGDCPSRVCRAGICAFVCFDSSNCGGGGAVCKDGLCYGQYCDPTNANIPQCPPYETCLPEGTCAP